MNKLYIVKVYTGLRTISHLTETVNAKNERTAMNRACMKARKSLFNSYRTIPPYTVAVEAKKIGGD